MFSFNCHAQWTNAVMDTLTHNGERDELNHQSLAIDQWNTTHLISEQALSGGGWMILYFQRPANGTWTTEDTVLTGPANEPTLAVSNTDAIPFVACMEYDSHDYEIMVYSRAGSNWVHDQVTNNQDEDMSPSIATDNQGFVHLAWIRLDTAGDFKINYATNRSGSWVIQSLANSQLGLFGAGALPQLALDPSGVAHIAYRGGNFGTYRIHHAYNDSIGGSNWNFDFPTSPNAEDLSSSIVVSSDSVVHLLVSGNDGFGFPTHAFYMAKLPGSGTFTNAVDVASGFSAETGCLFVLNHSPACVLNEVSGNIYTGNVIYSSAGTNWMAAALTNTQDIYAAQLVMDQLGNGTMAAYQGNTYPSEEIIVFGPDINTGIPQTAASQNFIRYHQKNNSLILQFSQSFKGEIQLHNLQGQILWRENVSVQTGEFKPISTENLAKGIYLLQGVNAEYKQIIKLALE